MPKNSTKKNSSKNIKKLVSDAVASKLSKTLEKKFVYQELYDQEVGQISINSAGYLSFLTTPYPSQGTSQNQRVGNKISITGFHYNCMLKEQSTNTSKTTHFYYALVNDRNNYDNVYTTGNADNPVQAMFKSNSFIRTAGEADAGIRTYGSPRNENTMGRFQVLRSGSFRIAPDMISPLSTHPPSNRVKSWSFGKKFKKPLEITYDSTSASVNNELFMVIFCDTGNISTTTDSTLKGGVPDLTQESGWVFAMNETIYYTDA